VASTLLIWPFGTADLMLGNVGHPQLIRLMCTKVIKTNEQVYCIQLTLA